MQVLQAVPESCCRIIITAGPLTALQRNWQLTTEPLSTLSTPYALLLSREQIPQSLGVQHIMAVTKPIGQHNLVDVDVGFMGILDCVARSDVPTVTYLSCWTTHAGLGNT